MDRRDRYAPIKAANAALRAKRERTVLSKYANGATTAEIASRIDKSVKTVQRILKANGVSMKKGPRVRLAKPHWGPTDVSALLFGPDWMRGKGA